MQGYNLHQVVSNAPKKNKLCVEMPVSQKYVTASYGCYIVYHIFGGKKGLISLTSNMSLFY